MSRRKRRLLFAVAVVLLVPAGVWLALYLAGEVPAPGKPAETPFNLSDRIATLEVVEESGNLRFVFSDLFGGGQGEMTPEEFAQEIQRRKRELPLLFRWLDVTGWTGLLWVLFGLAGQFVFMGRMLVQWWASEKARSSVVPPVFWWLSLLGSSMLLIYFIWRKEPVGFLGQCAGWLIYVRNLWFIHGETQSSPGSTAAAEEK